MMRYLSLDQNGGPTDNTGIARATAPVVSWHGGSLVSMCLKIIGSKPGWVVGWYLERRIALILSNSILF